MAKYSLDLIKSANPLLIENSGTLDLYKDIDRIESLIQSVGVSFNIGKEAVPNINILKGKMNEDGTYEVKESDGKKAIISLDGKTFVAEDDMDYYKMIIDIHNLMMPDNTVDFKELITYVNEVSFQECME